MTLQSYTTLGGTASNVKVGKVAHGLMLMTWVPNQVPDEQCFEAIKAGVDLLPPGVKMIINSAEFYAPDIGTANLELLSRFFEKYPEYAERTFLSVKGGNKDHAFELDSSPENLLRSVTACNAALRGTKRIDLFECARVDQQRPIEETVAALKNLVEQGLIDHIGLSEASAETLRKANAVHPISAIEIEVNAWSVEEETKKVLAVAEELGVAVVGYAPLGRGFLTGAIKSPDDIPEGDMRRRFTRFNNAEYFAHNMAIVDKLKAIADKKGVTAAQLSIAWVGSLGKKVIPLPGSSHAKRTVENTSAADIALSEADVQEVWDVINSVEVKGDRYYGTDAKAAHLWG